MKTETIHCRRYGTAFLDYDFHPFAVYPSRSCRPALTFEWSYISPKLCLLRSVVIKLSKPAKALSGVFECNQSCLGKFHLGNVTR
jgi:hypothetical protein